MSKVVDITGVSSKEARLKRIIASLEEIKDEEGVCISAGTDCAATAENPTHEISALRKTKQKANKTNPKPINIILVFILTSFSLLDIAFILNHSRNQINIP